MIYDIPKNQNVIYISRIAPLINQTPLGMEHQPGSKLAPLCKNQWNEEESDLSSGRVHQDKVNILCLFYDFTKVKVMENTPARVKRCCLS